MTQHNTAKHLLARLRMRQIALLLAIDDRKTLRAAADQLGLSQPAATKMLHELEHTIGQPLFDRVGRGLTLNQSGIKVLGYFRGIRGSFEALNRELAELQEGGAGRLAIGSIMAAAPGHLTDVLIELKACYPHLTVSIMTDTSDRLMRQLRDGHIDIVIGRHFDADDNDYIFSPMSDETLVMITGGSHPLAKKPRVQFSELLPYQWVLQPNGSPARAVVENEFRIHNTPLPKGLIETASILTMINLVDRSKIIGVIPEIIAQRHAKYGIISILNYKLDQKLSSYGILVRRERPLSAPAQRFINLFSEPVKSSYMKKP